MKPDQVCRFQNISGIPYHETLIYSVQTNRIKNSYFTKHDIEVCIDMLSPSRYSAQGKTNIKKLMK